MMEGRELVIKLDEVPKKVVCLVKIGRVHFRRRIITGILKKREARVICRGVPEVMRCGICHELAAEWKFQVGFVKVLQGRGRARI